MIDQMITSLLFFVLIPWSNCAQYKELIQSDPMSSETNSSISLAIVFDSTGSMGNDLKQVKLGSRRILRNHLKRGYKNLIKDFVLVQVHDPDVGPAKKTTSAKTFNRYLDSVYTQGGGDCPEMTIGGIEMALEAARPNSLIYVFTDSSAKDYHKTPNVLNLIQKKQSQVVFVLTGYCNSTEEIGFQVYREIAAISSGQIYLIRKGDVKEFMKIVENAVESLKVHLLQEDSSIPGSKTYSFPVDSHLTQLTIQVTNFKSNDSIIVTIRNPEGREITESNGLMRLMKNVNSVYFASLPRPTPGIWTLEVSTKMDIHSVRITGISEVDFLPGFSTIAEPYNYLTSRQPIKGVKNYLMANVTGNFLPGTIDWFNIMTINGSTLVRLPINQTENLQVYMSRYPFEILREGHFYIKLTGKDSRGYEMQRYSKIALIPRHPQPVSVSCPGKLSVKRGQNVNVTCLIQSEVPYTVSWYKNNVKITGAGTDNMQFKRTSNVTYNIDLANEVSQGLYACEIIPSTPKQLKIKGDMRDETVVTVLPPPPKVFVPKNASIEPTKDAELECNVYSLAPKVNLKWWKDIPRFEIKSNKRFRIEQSSKTKNSHKSRLIIMSATQSDSGRYLCVAEHEGGKNEASGFVKIHTMPSVKTDEKEITFIQNEEITAICKAVSVPPPKFLWYLNGNKLDNNDPRITITSSNIESQIKMKLARAEDAGDLTCKAQNSAGEDEVRIKTILISVPQIINIDIAKGIPLEGEKQNVRCIAEGLPSPMISWDFNGSPVSTDGNIIINQTIGTLDITRVEKYMKGEWTCLAKNKAGMDRKSFLLDIGFAPKIKNFENTIEATYGDNQTIKCNVEGQPLPRVKWFKGIPGGEFIPIAFGNRYFLMPDNSLQIQGITMEDQTVYTCEAENQHGKTRESVDIKLSGIVAPKIAFTQSKQVAVEGTLKKVLTCLVVESKPPAKISWLKNGKEIEYSERIVLKGNSLIIKNIKSEDEAIYTCIAKNQVGTAKFDMELDIQNKPIIIGDLKTFIEVSEGKKLVLQCLTKGDPKPKIEWRKGGRPLTMEPGSSFVFSSDGTELTIYSVVEENAGTFTCTATNDHAAVVKEFKITVKTPPTISKEGISDYEIGNKDNIELNCIVTSGSPSPKIEWFKNGQPLVEIPGRLEVVGQKNILKVYGNNDEESGSYECKASNEVGIDSKFYQITILVPPKVSESKTIKVYTRENERITLSCKIEGYPIPKKSWTWKGSILDLKRNPFSITNVPNEENDILITQMRSELQGIYICEGKNSGGSAKMTYDVIILESPKIIQFKDHSVFFVGNTITLTCIASGNPVPKIKWMFKGKLIPQNAPGYRMVGNNQETLIIDRAASINGGQYSCLAENEGGRDRKDSIVTVFVPRNGGNNGNGGDGTIVKNITYNQIIDGGNITFTCVMNSTPPAEIKWFKNDIDLYQALPKNRFQISDDGSTLTLFSVKAQDEGRYKCLAINIPGLWSLNFTLQVLISPVILGKHSSKPVINVNEETDLQIRCWSEGSPTPTYTWYRDNSQLVSGGRIEISNDGKTLKILKVRRSDDANYQCRVKNEAGEDKRTFNVNVFVPPSISGTAMRETPEFIRGAPADLWCNVTGYPTPKVKWDFPQITQSPLVLLNDSQLHFMNIDKSHMARYTCIATNEAGSARKVFDPIIIYPPKIINPDPETKRWILKGGEIRLTCNSESAPQATIEWLKDGELIKNHARINISNFDTQLHLYNAQESEVGSYKCLITNKLGQDKQIWSLDIMVPPTIRYSSLPGTHQVALGGTLYVFCVPDGRPKPKIQWAKDGSRIDLRRAILSEDGYHLTINTTMESDVGRYQCTAENIHGQADKSFDVQITYGPTLDAGGQRYFKIDRTVGGTVVLECLISGNPTPQIIWMKDGIPINRLPSYRYRKIGNNKQLEIIAMQAEDAGRYSCVAKNTFGQMEIFMDVSVGAPPTIERNRIRSEYIVKVGDELRLPCPATGSPIPNIAFSKENKLLEVKDPVDLGDGAYKKRLSISQERQMLTLFFAKSSDSGTYQCNASNSIGYDVMDYIVRVQAPPEFDKSNVQSEAYWYVNQTRSLECTLMGYADPPAKVTWERHGSPLGTSGNVRISPDGTRVTVENVQQYDAGEYRCYAQNEVAKISQTFQVLVYVKPRFYNTQIYQVIDAVQNKTIQLSCEATGQPRPRFSWYKQDREIFATQETYYNIAIIRGEQVLQISNIQSFDSDLYSCTASNGGGTIEKKFKINVILPPKIVKRTLGPENHKTNENVAITFHCNIFNFNITKPTMSWNKDGNAILLGDTDFYLTHNNGQSLTVMTPTINEAGRYTCEAENIAGRDSHSFILNVISHPKFPVDFSPFRETVTVQLGSSVNFQCPAEGSPSPTIMWFNRDIPISPYDMVNFVMSNNGKVLTIPSVGKDGGIFTCMAKNEAGNISKIYELEIIMPPLVRVDKVEVRERAGTTFSILCTAEGFPKPTLAWTRNGKGLFRLGTKADPKTGMLTIADAREDDSGRYTCTSTNKISSDSKSVDVIIISPPRIEIPKKPIMVRLGEQVLLPCMVDGTRPIRVHWYTPSNAQITTSIVGEYRFLPDQGLIIERVRKDHGGVYRCVANNDAGYQEIRVTLEVLVPPKIFRPAETEVAGILNSVLQIQCKIIEGLPSPQIVWERNGVILSKFKNYYTTTESGLFIFNSLKNDDEGSLTCIAKNAAGEDRLTFQINVELLPKVSLPMSITADEGSSVTINCRVEGKPKPTVIWKKEGQSLSFILGNRFRFNSDNEIYVFDIKPEDAGNYNCIGERPGAESSIASTYLSVFTRPKFYNKPKPRNVVPEGRWIIFHCEANSHPKPDIKWMFNGRSIDSRMNSNGRGSLVLGPLISENSGEYRCIAKNRVGNEEFRFILDVIAKPKVTVYQSDEPTNNRKLTTLICKVEGKVDSVIWLKNGMPVMNNSRMYTVNFNLVINNTESTDTGTYQCIASNSVGEAQGHVTFLVKSAPRFNIQPTNTTISIGEVLVLHCAADGYPVPEIIWYKNSRLVQMDFTKSIIKNGSLRIIGVQKEHEGIYYCVALNNKGEVHSSPAYVSIQIGGGWSKWDEWTPCSISCGSGTMSRKRNCNNPSPSNGGPYCIGSDIETRNCMLGFCPTNGGWSSWDSWSTCSSSCGSGLRHRMRRCDNPPPSNLGQSCLGDASEEILCEGNQPCPVHGAWSIWTPWTVCSVSCGIGGSQRRERKCDNPAPLNQGRKCLGKELEIRSCEKSQCPVDGGWSAWSKWSYCSKSCNNGTKQKVRRCDNPVPKFGGNNCVGNIQEKTACNASPCPVHGGWTNWGSWSECSTQCGGGLQERDRSCSLPKPSFEGQWCRGPAKDVQRCNEFKCQNNINQWTDWTPWSGCSETCVLQSKPLPVSRRTRKCLSPDKLCIGQSDEKRMCSLLPKCQITQKLLRYSLGEIRGILNNEDVGVVLLNGSWHSKDLKKTFFNVSLSEVKPNHISCFKVLTGLLTPLLWVEAYEVGLATNGYSISKGDFQMNSIVEFADGRSVNINHIFRTKGNRIKLLTNVNGACVASVSESKDIPISLEKYKEILIQMNPDLGKLISDSSRLFRIGTEIEPYQWSTNITVNKGKRQHFMVQQLLLQDILVKSYPAKKEVKFSVSSLIAEDDDSRNCPLGFSLIEDRNYCEDVNECINIKTNKCDQICENTIPRFKCHCRTGFVLGSDGRSCQDIDECSSTYFNNVPVCSEPDQECINTLGSYLCQTQCSSGFRRSLQSNSCEDINECIDKTNICGIHNCINTHGSHYCLCRRGYRKAENRCIDIDECTLGTNNCKLNQRCRNMAGTFHCENVCETGMQLVNGQCLDINECNTNSANCSSGATCTNLQGSYKCECKSGFHSLSGSCVDTDECKKVPSVCEYGCKNTYGSFECICPKNMRQSNDKKTCLKKEKSCKTGFKWNKSRGCIDIDECDNNEGPNPCQYKCINTYGSFQCQCPYGYSLYPRNNKCIDIDECKINSGICKTSEICINSPGNFSCVEPRCPSGYEYKPLSKSCVFDCAKNTASCQSGVKPPQIRFIVVHMTGAISQPVEVRVVNSLKQKESNCQYENKESSTNVPVTYEYQDGVIILKPSWKNFDVSVYGNQPYFLFFNVKCWASPNKQHQIFQNSFYIYVTLSKYSF